MQLGAKDGVQVGLAQASLQPVGAGHDDDALGRHLARHGREDVTSMLLGRPWSEVLQVEADGVGSHVGGSQDGILVVGRHEGQGADDSGRVRHGGSSIAQATPILLRPRSRNSRR